jgi:hypothetical protein
MSKLAKLLVPSLLLAGMLGSVQAEAWPGHKEKQKPKDDSAWEDLDNYFQPRAKKAPELSSGAAGASLALIAGGLLAMSGRRKRKTDSN